MNKLNMPRSASYERDLAQVIEPLASYICAADQPRRALASALPALLDEVRQTNRTASAHCESFAGSCSL